VIRCLQEQNIPHAPIEAIFSICEEVGLLGAKNVDVSKLKAKYGLVFDSDDPGFPSRVVGLSRVAARPGG